MDSLATAELPRARESKRSCTPLSVVDGVRHCFTVSPVHIERAEEDATYIATRSHRYPGALDIDVDWTREVLADPRLVAVVPYPRSRMGASGLVGWSRGAGRVLLVLAYQDLDGDLHGLNAWPASGRDPRHLQREDWR